MSTEKKYKIQNSYLNLDINDENMSTYMHFQRYLKSMKRLYLIH